MQINGEKMVLVEDINLKKFLDEADYDENRVVVERNGIIVSRETYAETLIHPDDVVEILYFVGGGAL